MGKNVVKPIKVWWFYKAPKQYQELSKNGGDEDWLAFVPNSYNHYYLGWLDSDAFGCCAVNRYKVKGGTIYIGCHA